MRAFGVDLSEWQGGIGIQRLRDEGAEFVIARLGGADAGLYEDASFGEFYDECKRLGMPMGAYFFSAAHTPDEARTEARYALSLLQGRKLEYPVYLDVEDSRHASMASTDPETLASTIDAFCSALAGAGWLAGVYSWSWLLGPCGSKLDPYELWICDWSDSRPTMRHGMWQFGGSTNVLRPTSMAGFAAIDQDYAYEDYPAIVRERGLNGYEEEEMTETEMRKLAKMCAQECAGYVYGDKDKKRNLNMYNALHWGFVYIEQLAKKVDAIAKKLGI